MHGTKKATEQLFKAFNIKNRDQEIVDTNIKMKELDGKYYAVIPFDKHMDYDQRISYLNSFCEKMKEKFGTVHFYGTSFPSSLNSGKFYLGNDSTVQFMIPIDSGFIFNLKHSLACSLVRTARAAVEYGFIGGCIKSVTFIDFDRKSYLHGLRFSDVGSRNVFVQSFLSEVEGYANYPSDPLEINGNDVYIKDIFNDVDFIKSIVEETACSIGRDLEVASNEDDENKAFKDRLTNLIYSKTGVEIEGYIRLSYLESSEDSIHVLHVRDSDGVSRMLTKQEVKDINDIFGYSALNNLSGCIDRSQLAWLPTRDYENGVYGIDFYDKEISNCVMNGLIQNAAIAKTDNGYGLVVNPNLQHRKSRKHSNLKDDLDRILLPKFYKDGYLDKPGLSKASNYIWQCLSKSKFGVEGYDMPELAEFVNQKIKEWRIIEEHQDKNIVIPKATNNTLQVPVDPMSDPMSDSTHSNDSGRGTDSQSGSPKEQPKVMLSRPVTLDNIAKNKGTGSQLGKIQLTISSTGYADNNMSTSRTEPLLSQGEPSQTRFVPRSVTLNIMATRSAPDPQQSLQNGQKTVQHVDKTCSAKPPASSSQQKSHDLLATAGTSASAIHKHSKVLSTLDETSVESSQSSIGSPKVTQKKNSGCIVM